MEMALVVGAIDIGTTFSGWAYSFLDDYEKDPTKGWNKQWNSGSAITEKTPTCLLVKPDGKTCHAFGYEAENIYLNLIEKNMHKEYFYFRRFKMALFKTFGQKLDSNLELKDEGGKNLPAVDVFSMSIKYLRDDMVSTLMQGFINLKEQDIHWVLTVPAIWSDAAKEFMRKSAEKAGIINEKLTFALEPEAASLYCRHLPVNVSKEPGDVSISSLPLGTKYIVVDAGGGTVDITIHQIHQSKTLREVRRASGGPWGGTMVDQAFEEFLIDTVGEDVFTKFKLSGPEDIFDLRRDFKMKKRIARTDLDINIICPALLSEIYASKTGSTLQEAKSDQETKLTFTKNCKIRFPQDMLNIFFYESVQKIVNHLRDLLKEESMVDVFCILMVGGYSECSLLQKAVKDAFPDKKVIIPKDPTSAVLRGSLIYGHSPLSISERKARYTYGTNTTVPFVIGKHPVSKRMPSDSGVRCNDVFSKFVEIDTTLKINESNVTKRFETVFKYQKEMEFFIYASTEKNPEYVDDASCTKIGSIRIVLDDPDKELGRKVALTMTFGGTEIILEAEDKKTGNKKIGTLSFLA